MTAANYNNNWRLKKEKTHTDFYKRYLNYLHIKNLFDKSFLPSQMYFAQSFQKESFRLLLLKRAKLKTKSLAEAFCLIYLTLMFI